MKVLIACEESQTSCIAFRRIGADAFSCDLQPCSGGFPEWHIQGDALEVLYSYPWDLVIAHPPCTYISRAGSRHAFPGGIRNEYRWAKTLLAQEFFLKFYHYSKCPIAIENPVPMRGLLPPATQYIQPYFFGDPYTKKTLLWLHDLPELVATDLVAPIGSWTLLHSSPKMRSKTFPGIACAFATQWGLGYGQKFLI